LRAIETTEAWARGEATIEQVREAADDAAAHADVAYADAAAAAAYAVHAAYAAAYADAAAAYAAAYAAHAAYAAAAAADAAAYVAYAAYAAAAAAAHKECLKECSNIVRGVIPAIYTMRKQ